MKKLTNLRNQRLIAVSSEFKSAAANNTPSIGLLSNGQSNDPKIRIDEATIPS